MGLGDYLSSAQMVLATLLEMPAGVNEDLVSIDYIETLWEMLK